MCIEHPFFPTIRLSSSFWLDGIISESFNEPEQSGFVGSPRIVLLIEPTE
jgi:hypothetical protein